jgi:hypothetical protein
LQEGLGSDLLRPLLDLVNLGFGVRESVKVDLNTAALVLRAAVPVFNVGERVNWSSSARRDDTGVAS